MIFYVKNVQNASVKDGEKISEISKGLLIYVGFTKHESREDILKITNKILSKKIFPDNNEKRWAKTIREVEGEILVIPNFTLSCRAGSNKPNFIDMAPIEKAKDLFEYICSRFPIIFD